MAHRRGTVGPRSHSDRKVGGVFYIAPEDPVITSLVADQSDPVEVKMVEHIQRHGFTTVAALARALGLKDNMVRLRCDYLGLKRKRVVKDRVYFNNMGYRLGHIEDAGADVIEWLILHHRGDESFTATAGRLLRGDAKPHPHCGCSFCLRSRG